MVQEVDDLRKIACSNLAMQNSTDQCLSKLTDSTRMTQRVHKIQYLLGVRVMVAVIMSACFVALSITATNLSGSIVCMLITEDNAQTLRTRRQSIDDTENATSASIAVQNECPQDDKSRSENGGIPQIASVTAQPSNSSELRSLIRRNAGQSHNVEVRKCFQTDQLLNWTSLELGLVLGAQNFGSLLMIVTGAGVDRLNGKVTIACAIFVTIISNLMLPLLATTHIAYALVARVLCGVADALLSPSVSAMIARWFPPKERPFAIGIVTGGRQIGSLFILPVSGYLCSRREWFGGWQPTFFISAIAGLMILLLWSLLSADKPSKHCCISKRETRYILRKIDEEALGKVSRKERKSVPWRSLLTSRPLIVAILALVCHEYPLVITVTYLPIYFKRVLHFSNTMGGFSSAAPLLALWASKTLSSSLSSYLSARKHGRCLLSRTALVKLFNGVASGGLALSLFIVPVLTKPEQIPLAVLALCTANAFAGLHTPGVQTALLQIAPAYTGILTGIAFSAAAIASMINKLTNGLILDSSTDNQWTILFEISAAIAFLPVIFFSIWGSADLQPWAIPEFKESNDVPKQNSNQPPIYLIDALSLPTS